MPEPLPTVIPGEPTAAPVFPPSIYNHGKILSDHRVILREVSMYCSISESTYCSISESNKFMVVYFTSPFKKNKMFGN